jgi:hypothetical protein
LQDCSSAGRQPTIAYVVSADRRYASQTNGS